MSKLSKIKEFLKYRITRRYKDMPYSERPHFKMQIFPPIVWDVFALLMWVAVIGALIKYVLNSV